MKDVKLKLRSEKLKDGRQQIRIAVGGGKNLYLSTGLACLASEWDETLQKYIWKNANQINMILSTLLSNAKIKVYELMDSDQFNQMSSEDLKVFITGKTLKKEGKTMIKKKCIFAQ